MSGGYCPGDVVRGDVVRGILSGGYCPGGYCPDTTMFVISSYFLELIMCKSVVSHRHRLWDQDPIQVQNWLLFGAPWV